MDAAKQSEPAELVYDSHCPICRVYCRRLEQSELDGIQLKLVDARERPDQVANFRADGIDIDNTVVLSVGGQRLTGADAFNHLARLDRERGAFGWLNRFLFAARGRARILYPIFVRLRAVLLRILGVTRL
jgi:predicted DCC family thiol-disulfide oxidoreductase YuxK